MLSFINHLKLFHLLALTLGKDTYINSFTRLETWQRSKFKFLFFPVRNTFCRALFQVFSCNFREKNVLHANERRKAQT